MTEDLRALVTLVACRPLFSLNDDEEEEVEELELGLEEVRVREGDSAAAAASDFGTVIGREALLEEVDMIRRRYYSGLFFQGILFCGII